MRKCAILLTFFIMLSGCMSLSRAGNTDFHYKTKEIELTVNSGKDYESVNAKMWIDENGIQRFEYNAQGVNATDAIKETAAVAKESVGALKDLGEIGVKVLSPLP